MWDLLSLCELSPVVRYPFKSPCTLKYDTAAVRITRLLHLQTNEDALATPYPPRFVYVYLLLGWPRVGLDQPRRPMGAGLLSGSGRVLVRLCVSVTRNIWNLALLLRNCKWGSLLMLFVRNLYFMVQWNISKTRITHFSKTGVLGLASKFHTVAILLLLNTNI
jgi:hypothetical protein